MAQRLLFLAVLIALGPSMALTGCSYSGPDQQPAPGAVQIPGAGLWLGAGSCSAAACHNANGLKGETRSEYTTWAVHDVHARAYDVLLNAKSRSIVKNLQLGGDQQAHEMTLCLNCHVHKDFGKAEHHPRFSKEDGVSCESCHGPAGSWRSDHYKVGWNRKGMWETRTIAGRVRTCTPCHVGAPGMEVSHDLIAAGHPRLAFEFSAYHALLPHHWPDEKDKKAASSAWARTDWEAAAWFVGQALTSQAAAELLTARADSKIWPEFAEFDCYACHHQLQHQSWRQDIDLVLSKQRKIGQLPLGDWYLNSLSLITHPQKSQANDLVKELGQLRHAMENAALPGRAAARQSASAVAKGFEKWAALVDSTRLDGQDSAAILKRIIQHGADQPARSWDDAAQTYLAVMAMQHAKAEGIDLRPQLKDIRELLRFAPGGQSPRSDFTPRLLVDHYGQMLKRIQQPP